MFRRVNWLDVLLIVLAFVSAIGAWMMDAEFYDAAAFWTHP